MLCSYITRLDLLAATTAEMWRRRAQETQQRHYVLMALPFTRRLHAAVLCRFVTNPRLNMTRQTLMRRHTILSYDQLRAALLIGRNAVTCSSAKSTVERAPCDSHKCHGKPNATSYSNVTVVNGDVEDAE